MADSFDVASGDWAPLDTARESHTTTTSVGTSQDESHLDPPLSARTRERPALVPRLSARGPNNRAMMKPKLMSAQPDCRCQDAVPMKTPQTAKFTADAEWSKQTCHHDTCEGPSVQRPGVDVEALAADIASRLEAMERRLEERLQLGIDRCVDHWSTCRELLHGLREAPPAMPQTEGGHHGAGGEGHRGTAGEQRHHSGRCVPDERIAERITNPPCLTKEVSFNRTVSPTSACGGQSSCRRTELEACSSQHAAEQDIWGGAGREHMTSRSSHSHASSASLHSEMDADKSLTARIKRSTLQKASSWLGEPETNSRLAVFAMSQRFGIVALVMTLANTIAVGVDTDMTVTQALSTALGTKHEDKSAAAELALSVAQQVFLAWLIFEVVVKLAAFRVSFFFGPDRFWNWFDVTILLAAMLTTLTPHMSSSYLRALRIARASRALQAVRFVHYCESLQRLVGKISAVAMSLFWAACLAFIFIYMVGVAMMEGVTGFLEGVHGSVPDEWREGNYAASTKFGGHGGGDLLQALQMYYGGAGRTWMTLFRAVTGSDWSAFAAPLAAIGWAWGALWFAYIFCTCLGLLNMVTGVIVDIVRRPLPTDRALQLAAEAKEERALVEFVTEEFKRAGKGDEEATMNHKAFRHFVKRSFVSKRLKHFGVDVEHIQDLHQLVDPEGHGEITAGAAAKRFLELRGEARSLSVARISRELVTVRREVASLLPALFEVGDSVKEEVRHAIAGEPREKTDNEESI